MGCSASKAISSGEEASSGMRPIRRKIEQIRWQRIEQIRRQRRGRKDSIVSTTELLGGAPEEILAEVPDDEELQVDACTDATPTTEEINVADEQVSPDSSALPPPPPEAETIIDVDGTGGEVDGKDGQEKGEEERGEEKCEKEAQKGDEESEKEEGDEKSEKEEGDEKSEQEGGGWKGGDLLRPPDEDEEFPGSPSFRVYSPYYRVSDRCSSDEDSIQTGSRMIEEDGIAGNNDDDHERKDSLGSSNSEGSESGKSTKKNRGKRFKALAVCSLLSVRSCYHTNNAIQNDKPQLLTQKAA